jgi:D-arginine dehydrogenase
MSDFDVIVIGGGIAGASAAAELARTHRVVLLEREWHCGYHSTGRSAALFSETYGNATVRALSRASRDFLFSPPAGFADYELVRPRGAMHIASREHLDLLETLAGSPDVQRVGRRLDATGVREVCPALREEAAVAGIIEPGAADVDVDALHQGYLRLFRKSGGTIVTDAEVRGIEHRDGRWHVDTAAGAYHAPCVVNAAGAWVDDIARLAGVAPCDIVPCRRTAVLVELPQGVDATMWPLVVDIAEQYYFKPDAGLLLISPADETPVVACDVQPEELDVAIVVDRVEHATTLKITRLRKRWAGLRSFSPDRSPVIGFDAATPGFFWLAGQGGFGIQTAPAAAMLTAALIRKDQTEIDRLGLDPAAVSPSRFASA